MMFRRRLAILVVAVGGLVPLGMHAAQAAPTPLRATPGMSNSHWACVGEVDLDVGVCVDNPIPPRPF